MALALFIAYILAPDVLAWITVDREDRWPVMFLLMVGLWFLFSMILTALLAFLWAYIVKYWLPPKLQRPVPDPAPPSHFQGLGLGPK
jgi:predicted permease